MIFIDKNAKLNENKHLVEDNSKNAFEKVPSNNPIEDVNKKQGN